MILKPKAQPKMTPEQFESVVQNLKNAARDEMYLGLLFQEVRMWFLFGEVTRLDYDFVVERRGFDQNEQIALIQSFRVLGLELQAKI